MLLGIIQKKTEFWNSPHLMANPASKNLSYCWRLTDQIIKDFFAFRCRIKHNTQICIDNGEVSCDPDTSHGHHGILRELASDNVRNLAVHQPGNALRPHTHFLYFKRTLGLDRLKGLNLVTDLNVIVIFNSNTTFVPGDDFSHIVLESAK